MAIDTETKRRSMAGKGLLFLVILPVPDGTISATDRMHIAGFYSGIEPGVPPAGILTDYLHIFSTVDVEPSHVSDSGDNVLFGGDVEVKGTIYAAGSNVTGSQFNTTSVIATYTILASDDLVFADGEFTITMPTGVGSGKTYTVKNTGTGSITLASSNLIDELASVSIPAKVAFRVSFDGTTWWIA